MQVTSGMDTEVVAAARAGDEQARDRLVAGCLPLVYNVVGRAMNGHPDVDDVVQETMIRVVNGLDGVRDLASFRSWLVAVAMNEVRRCWSTRRAASVSGLDDVAQVADPSGDFVGLTVLRLGLSGQRRETAEATRWLDENDRDLLSLWWQEAAGQLTRAELATAMELSPQHAAVRVQRMKEQLEISRTVVRALAATPRCPALDEVVAGWDGRPSPLLRKRIARHTRSCGECSDFGRDLVPAEGLLSGLILVIPPHGFGHFSLTSGFATPTTHAFASSTAGHTTAAHSSAHLATPIAGPLNSPEPQALQQLSHSESLSDGAGQPGGLHRRAAGRGANRRLRHGAQLAGTLAIAAVALAVVRVLPEQSSHVAAPVAEPSPETATAIVTPPPVPGTADLASPTPPPSPSASSSVSPKPSSTPRPTAGAPGLERQLIDLINTARAKNGCQALHIDPKLHSAAQQHAQDMAANHYFDHVDQQGRHADGRITAAGYQWSLWGENLDRNTKSPAQVLNDWMDGAIHQESMLDCQYTDAGVGIASAIGGPLWTLDVAAPS
ncbi:sigma-70 family RNA polymerase sigma factor [Kitasatospora sp. NPDC127059]|uniref:sigma-70 family RNA polymerase sigma factor n=1 Tax=unclassified Kitasatospora TaxID=2633591 RepID=UPI00366598C6